VEVDEDNVDASDVQSYFYDEYLPGSCDPWFDHCQKSSASGGGWDQSCLQGLLTAPEYNQGDPDSSALSEVSWEFVYDTSGASCATTGTDASVVTGTEGSCTQYTFTYDNNGTPDSMQLYASGYCDSVTDHGTFASFATEAECLAYTAVDSNLLYNYSWSYDAFFIFSGMESATCVGDDDGSAMMTCSNWCSSTSGNDLCDALKKAGKALGTMLLIIIISIVVVSILGAIGCWYCCCRSKGEQTVVVQGGQAGVPMAAPVTQAQPPGAVYMKNGMWLDKNDQPVAAQQV
jgi:hypothetical protein